MEHTPVRRALLSVSDKKGLIPFAAALAARGTTLLSTGGTAKALMDAGLAVVPAETVTGFPEMLDGRVKTLHPAIHGGILADRDRPEHLAAIAAQSIEPIDLVVVNLYPFRETVAQPDVTLEGAIENIDIGGPAMVRSAAKNHQSVGVVVDPADYQEILAELERRDGLSLSTRRRLMAKAFAHTAAYDAAIADFFESRFVDDGALPKSLRLSLPKAQDLRYGENPHQKAALYRAEIQSEPCIAAAIRRDCSGKEVSFNNLYDLDGALELIKEFPERPAAAIIKHANPCGCALGETLEEAFIAARDADTISAFGGILAVNRPLDLKTAERITGPNTFFECVVAPGYEPGVVEHLTTKKKWGANLRLLEVGSLADGPGKTGFVLKQIVGGMLAATRDYRPLDRSDLTVASERQPDLAEMDELLFAWRCVKHVKSNAIVISKGRAIRGVGAGQMNRVRSVRLAVEQAGDYAKGAALASDAFFPFPDGPEAVAKAGVTAIIQPGGSVKDEETIALCDEWGIALVMTGVRHFRH